MFLNKTVVMIAVLLACVYCDHFYHHVNSVLVDNLETAFNANSCVTDFDFRMECNMIEMKHWTARRYARNLGRANRYHEKVLRLEVDDLKMVRTFSRAIAAEYAALSGFFSFMNKKCTNASTDQVNKESYIRRVYWFTRQAQRNPMRFARQVGPSVYDYIKDAMTAVLPSEYSNLFITYYVSADIPNMLALQASLMAMVSWTN